jgi:hypothetical protein
MPTQRPHSGKSYFSPRRLYMLFSRCSNAFCRVTKQINYGLFFTASSSGAKLRATGDGNVGNKKFFPLF